MLLSVLSALLFSTAISFAGSVQLGPVNFGTIHTALNKNKKSAIYFGLGGSLPELLYCGLAFGSSELIMNFEGLAASLKYLTSAVLFLFGLFLVFQKAKKSEGISNFNDGNVVWVGTTMGLLNPQLYPFWLFVITYLRSNNILVDPELPQQVAFVIGAALGAFLLQLLVAEFTSRKKDIIYKKATDKYNQILGGIIILVAIAQLLFNQ